ncbi:MAG: response regulator transcription factor [Agriterribacter sp.]
MESIKKILIADDHTIVSRGLYYLITLNFTGVHIGEVHSLRSLMTELSQNTYTHLILDLNLDDGNSMDVLPGIKQQYPGLLILIYSMVSEEVFGKKLMQYEISGFLSKKSSETEVVQALKVFLEGGIFVSKKLKGTFETPDGDRGAQNIFTSLSVSELKVLGMILKGSRTKEIAYELGVTQQTVATYKSRIFKKLGTDNIFDIQKLTELYNVNLS